MLVWFSPTAPPCPPLPPHCPFACSFEGVDIGGDGTVPFRSGERISFSYLVSQVGVEGVWARGWVGGVGVWGDRGACPRPALTGWNVANLLPPTLLSSLPPSLPPSTLPPPSYHPSTRSPPSHPPTHPPLHPHHPHHPHPHHTAAPGGTPRHLQKYKGDVVHLRVLHARRERGVSAALRAPRRLIPVHINQAPPSYFICGGLVFSPVTVPLLKSEYGKVRGVCGCGCEWVGSDSSLTLHHTLALPS